MAISNGDGPQVTSLFGFPVPDTTGAGGSEPSRTRPPDEDVPDSVSGTPGGSGNITPLSEQVTNGRCMSPENPGQEDIGFAGLGDPAYTNTSTGGGHTDAWSRFDWQSPAPERT